MKYSNNESIGRRINQSIDPLAITRFELLRSSSGFALLIASSNDVQNER